jgi:hypothetical protein
MSDRAMAIAFVLLVTLAIGGIVTAVVAGARAGRPEEEPAISASCSEWTDGCVICRRGADGPVCSTPGIACLRSAPVCLSR